MSGETTAAEEADHWDTAATAGPLAAAWGPGSGDSDDQVAMVCAWLPRVSPVLDLGCGPGRVTARLAESCWWREHGRVVGVDVSAEMIAPAVATAAANVEYRVGDGRTIPAGDGEFAAAFSVLLFQHLGPAAVRGYLVELRRVIRPGGTLLFQFVEGAVHNPFDHRYRLGEMLCWCCDIGWSAVEVERRWFHRDWTWVESRNEATGGG